MNKPQHKDEQKTREEERSIAKTIVGAIAIGALATTAGMTTACCSYIPPAEGEGEGESG